MRFAAWLVLAWLSGHGYDPVQRDAVFVAAQGESNLDPAADSGRGDIGLFQWRGQRRQALFDYERRRVPALRRQDPALGDAGARLTAQLEFMDREWRAMPQSREFFQAAERHRAFLVFCRHFSRRRGCR